MPDLLAGQRIKALDFTPTVSDSEPTDITGITSTSFTASGGNVCGVAFMAPTTGRVFVHHRARLGASGVIGVEVTPVVRTGSSVGSGSDVVAASSNNAVRWLGINNTAGDGMGSTLLVTGLTPGDPYNVQLEHRVSGGTGIVGLRHVVVAPAT